jgi:hypothetical protein
VTTAEINARAAADFYGPAVYKAPRVVDVGEHKLDAWKLREPSAPKPRRAAAPAKPVRQRDRHPFGYKRYGKSYPTGGRVDPGTVVGKPWPYGARPTR